MGYNALSGTIAIQAGDLSLEQLTATTVSGNLLYGDGSEITNLPRIVANASADNLLTVGANAHSMVGEPNLRFDGSLLSVTGDITASSGISASVFYGDGSGLTNVLADHVVAEGPTYALQYHDTDGDLTGSANFLYSGSTLSLTGTLNMSGAMNLEGSLQLEGDLVPTLANTYDLGSADNPWKDLYISGSSIHFGSDVLSVGSDNNLKFGSGSTTKGFDVGFMNFKNNGIFMDPGRIFQLRAYQMQFYGGISYVRKVTAVNYAIKTTDYLVAALSDEATITLTLPSASVCSNGQTFVIKDEGGAADIRNVSVVVVGSDTIDGQNSIVLESPYASIQLYCNGLNKYFVC